LKQSDCSSYSGETEELELRKQLKAELNELVFYKIEMPSASSNKKIISCIERIIEIINIISNSNSNLNCNQKDNKQALLAAASIPNKSVKISELKEEIKKEKVKFKDFNFYEVLLY